MVPRNPGFRTLNNDHKSSRRFSTGVPVSAMRRAARMPRIALVTAAVGFLRFCDSSTTSRRHRNRCNTDASSRATANEVTTRSASAIASCSVSLVLARPGPWCRQVARVGAKRLASRCQLPTTDVGATTRVGPSSRSAARSCSTAASTWTVLPSPMSSARQAPKPSRSRYASQEKPRTWYSRNSPANAPGWSSICSEPLPRNASSIPPIPSSQTTSGASEPASACSRSATVMVSSPASAAQYCSRRDTSSACSSIHCPRSRTRPSLAATISAHSSRVIGVPSRTTCGSNVSRVSNPSMAGDSLP